jgi:hypothetical protein
MENRLSTISIYVGPIPAAAPYDPLRDKTREYGKPGSQKRLDAYRDSVQKIKCDVLESEFFGLNDQFIGLLKPVDSEPGLVATPREIV